MKRFYAPLGLGEPRYTHWPGLRLWIGRIGPGELQDVSAWGGPTGAPPDPLAATDRQLREWVGLGCLMAAREGRARILTAPSGPTALYACRSESWRAWATHAVAASLLATGFAELDDEAIPELLAFDYVGGDRTLVRGVRPVAHASEAELSAEGIRERSWWPAQERWARVEERAAQAHADAALLASLDARLRGRKAVQLALTAGADSRVLAVAVDELGIPFGTFTWGEDGYPDAEGARAVAAALGVPNQRKFRWLTDSETLAASDAGARWSDGVLGLSAAERHWPPEADAVVIGMAGEVGRAFYWRRAVTRTRRPRPHDLTAELDPAGLLAGAAGDAVDTASAAVAGWMESARASGLSRWRLLDVLYAEQRVARWGRGQLPRMEADLLAGFAPVEVLRGLVSLPQPARLADGFHREFVASRRPDLTLPAPAAVPSAPGAMRRLLRRAARPRRSAPGSAPPAAADPLFLEIWRDRPETLAWICDEALGPGSPAERVLGEAWAARTREGLLAGLPRPTDHALLACGPAALAVALRDLRPQTPAGAARMPPRPMR